MAKIALIHEKKIINLSYNACRSNTFVLACKSGNISAFKTAIFGQFDHTHPTNMKSNCIFTCLILACCQYQTQSTHLTDFMLPEMEFIDDPCQGR